MPGMPDRPGASRRRSAAAFPVPGGACVPRVALVTDPHAPPGETVVDRGFVSEQCVTGVNGTGEGTGAPPQPASTAILNHTRPLPRPYESPRGYPQA